MTRLLLDENVPRSAAPGLAVAGHKVKEIAALAQGWTTSASWRWHSKKRAA